MSSLVVISGAPGTGKTTVARILANASPLGLHIGSDVFYTFPARPIPPHLTEARAKNAAMIAAMTRTAATFAAHGYDVFPEGIVGPWFLPTVKAELARDHVDARYVVLQAPLAVTIERVRIRRDETSEEVVIQMHAHFAGLGPYADHQVATGHRTPEDVAGEIRNRIAAGDWRL